MKKTMVILIAFTFFSTTLLANENNEKSSSIDKILSAENIIIYDFAYGGTGCPSGSVSALLSPDFKNISMFFDKYIADSTKSRRGRDRKSCNIGISVLVPHGLSVALVKLDYRGYVDNATNAYSSLQAEYFFAGYPAGSTFLKEWKSTTAPVMNDFYESDQFNIGAIVWSACGVDAILRANTSIKAYQGSKKEPAYIQLDTIDTRAEIIYQLQWKTCTM